MFRILILGAILFATSPAFAEDKPKTSVADLAWLTGTWASTKDGVETEENWNAPKGGLMLGTNRTVSGKGKPMFEFLRIADTEKGVSYFASPMGRAATEFPLKTLEKEKVTFENAKHDYPQRILYWKADGKLHARIEGTIGGRERSQEWVWEK